MAWRNRPIGGVLPALGSTNVTALSYSGNPPVYSSGGIPQGVVVKGDASDGTVGAVTIASTGDLPFGVADTAPAAGPGDPVEVQVAGVARIMAHAAISIYDQVYVANTDGTIGTVPAAGATSVNTVGIALEAAAQAGDFISVLLTIGGSQKVAS